MVDSIVSDIAGVSDTAPFPDCGGYIIIYNKTMIRRHKKGLLDI